MQVPEQHTPASPDGSVQMASVGLLAPIPEPGSHGVVITQLYPRQTVPGSQVTPQPPQLEGSLPMQRPSQQKPKFTDGSD
jgi:hypothetical protein